MIYKQFNLYLLTLLLWNKAGVGIKQVFLSLLIGLCVAIALPTSVYAVSSTTDVSGVITINGNTVNGADVVVVCNNHSQTTVTDSKGLYTVRFNAKDCPDGSKATIVATQSDLGGVSTTPIKTGAVAAYSVDIVDASVPEFGVIAGFVAAIAGGAVFLKVRRQSQISQN